MRIFSPRTSTFSGVDLPSRLSPVRRSLSFTKPAVPFTKPQTPSLAAGSDVIGTGAAAGALGTSASFMFFFGPSVAGLGFNPGEPASESESDVSGEPASESESSFGFAASATSSGAADFAGGPPEFSDAAGFVGAVALGLGAGTSGFFGFVCKASNTHTKRNSTFSRRNSCGVHRIEPYRSCSSNIRDNLRRINRAFFACCVIIIN